MSERPLGTHYLKQWRERRGLSLRALAGLMEKEPGVPLTSHANIGRIENFQQPYSQEILEAAAVALNCTVADLISRPPDKAPLTDSESQLRSALLAFGVDKEDLGRAVSAVKVFLDDPGEPPLSDPRHGQPEPSNRPHESAPSRKRVQRSGA